VAYLPLGHLGHAPPGPPLNCEKILRMAKKCNQNAPFSGKNLNNFLGRGHTPQTLAPLGREIPLTRHSPSAHLTLGAAALDPLQFFPNFYHYAVIDEFGKSNRQLVLLVDLGLLNGTRLEVGPVNIQSSH